MLRCYFDAATIRRYASFITRRYDYTPLRLPLIALRALRYASVMQRHCLYAICWHFMPLRCYLLLFTPSIFDADMHYMRQRAFMQRGAMRGYTPQRRSARALRRCCFARYASA